MVEERFKIEIGRKQAFQEMRLCRIDPSLARAVSESRPVCGDAPGAFLHCRGSPMRDTPRTHDGFSQIRAQEKTGRALQEEAQQLIRVAIVTM